MMKRPPNVVEELTPCEIMTRVVRPLGGFLKEEVLEPQETRLTLAKATKTSAALFKRKAPNDMKNGDLSAKSWIIADLRVGNISV
jgi:hypothetical protein